MTNSETTKCSICGKDIPTGEEYYSYGTVYVPTGEGEWLDEGVMTTPLGQDVAVVEWSGDKVALEYVECATCDEFFEEGEDE